MFHLTIRFETESTNPEATLQLDKADLQSAWLSVASRAIRNRTALYQQKHTSSMAAGLCTRDRDSSLDALNVRMADHFSKLNRVQVETDLQARRVVGFAISDLTANPLRPHYDSSLELKPRGQDETCSDEPLFYLQDEPIRDASYSILFCYRQGDHDRFAILHGIKITNEGKLPEEIPLPIVEGLRFWAACPPLLINGEHRLNEFAVLDYDLRHVFGFPQNELEKNHLLDTYRAFSSWENWVSTIRRKLEGVSSPAAGYHAALGLSDSSIIILHRTASIPDMAVAIKSLGAREAVLLDSGGSCAIWANWINGRRGGVLANAWNYREKRGAVMFLVLQGVRLLPKTNP